MHTRPRRIGAGAVVFGALAAVAVVAGNRADAQQPAPTPILGQEFQGTAALARAQSRIAELADRNGIPADRLEQILATDKTSWLDRDGKLFYREPVASARQQKPAAAPSPRWATQAVAGATGPAFELHSKPGSNRVIYLDFDGHTITGTAWNTTANRPP